MTGKEAIEMLRAWNKDLSLMEDEEDGIKCHELAISALEKQIPRKLTKSNMTTICPECGRTIKRCYDYCPECGQCIDWGD